MESYGDNDKTTRWHSTIDHNLYRYRFFLIGTWRLILGRKHNEFFFARCIQVLKVTEHGMTRLLYYDYLPPRPCMVKSLTIKK